MKKNLSLLLVMLVVVLSGCGKNSDYEQMVDDLGQIKAMQYAVAEVGFTVEGVDLNYTMEFDTKTPLFHGRIAGVDIYLDSDNAYMNIMDNWFQAPATEEVKADFEEEFDAEFFTMDMPAGDEVISVDSGMPELDDAVNGKTYDEVIIATETGYTIVGLEDSVEIDTADNQLTIKYVEGDNNAHITFGKTEKFELPAEAKDGKVIPSELLASL